MNIAQSMKMNSAERAMRIMEKQKLQWGTKLNFLKSHMGFRDANIHLFLGTSGAGKSTMMRTLLRDFLLQNPFETIGVWLSEETVDDFKDELAKFNDPVVQEYLDNVFATSEMEGKQRHNLRSLQEYFIRFISEIEPSVLIFDNITTSAMYDNLHPNDQVMMQGWFKEIAIKRNIPIVFFAHTGAEITDSINRLINQQDIKGSRGICNIAQYLYVMQRFEIGRLYFPTLRVVKYRGYSVEDRLYYLNYDKEESVFSLDWALPWEEFIEAFSKRNQLK